MMKVLKLRLLLTLAFMALFIAASAQDEDLFDMSLEELMNMEITSVSKKAEKLQDVPSAMYVITSNDIERSSSRTMGQLLQEHVPGYWGVSIDFKNVDGYIRNNVEGSVLILLDGTPMNDLLQTVLSYDNFDIPLEEIDRIEVIKGSGGTIYGANSATGVINIFTKDEYKNHNFRVGADYGMPGYLSANLGYANKYYDKLDVQLYGKFMSFDGYEQISEVENATSIATSSATNTDTTITNRFTGDDRSFQSVVAGLKLGYKLSEKAKIGMNIHFNNSSNSRYFHYYPAEYAYLNSSREPRLGRDTLYLMERNNTRIVGNLRFDYNFTDNHGLFVRVSSNMEDYLSLFNAGIETNNNILDFEVQDNLSFGINNLSFGGNFRMVNYDLNSLQPTSVNFVDPQNSETLTGLFIQNKMDLSEKLHVYLGVKAENFSLIDNKFYLSPMAKVTYKPIDKLTLWGGFTQSYTTPGYINTNVDLNLFRAVSPDVFYDYAYPQVRQGVYQDVYNQFIAGGADEATASAQASGFIASPQGMYVIDSVTTQQIALEAAAFPGHFNVDVINGEDTKPTSFQNIEFGLRTQPLSNLSIEINGFYTLIDDGIYNTPDSYLDQQIIPVASPTKEGEYSYVYYYGNLTEGSSFGFESVIKSKPVDMLTLELSHTYFKSELKYKENDYFNVSEMETEDRTITGSDYPTIPENVFRLKVFVDLPSEIFVSLSALYSTKYYNNLGTANTRYQYDKQQYQPLVGDDVAYRYPNIGENDNLTKVNLKIEKLFLDKKLSVYLYGNDILNDGAIEATSPFLTVYPRQTGRMVGGGLTYKF